MNSNLKQKLKNKEVTLGSWITLGHPSIAEIMVQAGFDWLTIDLEHSGISLTEAQRLIQVIDLAGCAPLVRVGENHPTVIKRVMDMGSHGVIVPMVNTKEEAIRAVESVKYPPQGKRGVGLARAQRYGVGFEEYRDWAIDQSTVIVQIEHIDAVENFSDIMSVDGVDGFMVGPYDLSASMGKPGQFYDDDVVEALAHVQKLADEKNILSGVHVIPPKPEEVIQKINEGFRFIAFSLDTLYLATLCREGLSEIKKQVK